MPCKGCAVEGHGVGVAREDGGFRVPPPGRPGLAAPEGILATVLTGNVILERKAQLWFSAVVTESQCEQRCLITGPLLGRQTQDCYR